MPPATVFGVLGSDVYFHWNFSFANSNDWSNFEEIYWGKTDNNERIRDKYLTVSKDGSVLINDILPPSIKSRLNVTKTINKHGCSVHFVLQSVTLSDELVTYGCTAMVEGDGYKEGPIRLVLRGKAHFRLFLQCLPLRTRECLAVNNLISNRSWIHLVQRDKQHHRKVLLSSFHLNGNAQFRI